MGYFLVSEKRGSVHVSKCTFKIMFNSLTLGFAPLNDDLYRSRHVFFCILHDIIEGDVLKE